MQSSSSEVISCGEELVLNGEELGPCNSICNTCYKWDVRPFTDSPSQIKYALVVLNRPISQNFNFIKNIWNNASVIVAVDGGANRWDTYLSALSKEVQQTMRNPDMITGDFDSINEEIMEKYKKKGCKIIHTPDQNYTDFTKALIELNTYCQQHNVQVDHVLALSQSSGRLDQILGNIQTLYLAKDKGIISPKMKLYMISDDAISWLLSPGNHTIDVPEETRLFRKSWCSLVPVGEKCESVTSQGLKWNIDKGQLRFGDLVSTSNAFDGSEEVFVNCSHSLLWSMRLPSIGGLFLPVENSLNQNAI